MNIYIHVITEHHSKEFLYCIQAREPRSFVNWGRPLVGVGGRLALSSWTHSKTKLKSGKIQQVKQQGSVTWKKDKFSCIMWNSISKNSKVVRTCIHVSSVWSGDPSAKGTAGGKGWMSFGTTTRSRPKTKIAPALLAVPAEMAQVN